MILIFHIIIAVISIGVGVMLIVRPSERLLAFHASGASLTIASGVGLLFAGYSLQHVCAAGLVYLVLAVAIAGLATYKLRVINSL